ncbi:helix-turn-helix domain-containing protein [Rhodococcus sovatensis]|uniref:Helix-turn-helix domain-containing protein n=1 Tax=Rhodococcus sovatensis TaxID=1805840 RepID=A0ABZ2PM97_9NOCA
MNDFDPPRPNDEANPRDSRRWQELLDGLDVAELTATFVERVASITGYDSSPLPTSEIERSGRLAFSAMLQGLRSGGLPDFVPIANDVGVSRARAGIPITSLMTAIRLDYNVLWEALTSASSPSDAELLVRHTWIVLRTVDEYAAQTQRAYMAERERMLREESSALQGRIANLFQDHRSTAADRLDAIAAELRIPRDAPLLVIGAAGDDIPALRVYISQTERSGRAVYTHYLGDILIAFMCSFDLDGPHATEAGRSLLALRVGIVTAGRGLSDLRAAANTTRDLTRTITSDDDTAITWNRGWARLAKLDLQQSRNGLLADVDNALARCGNTERARLMECVRSYLRTGSVGESADELFCHRNTVSNRLHRFAKLTGVDPTIPEQSARLVVGWS